MVAMVLVGCAAPTARTVTPEPAPPVASPPMYVATVAPPPPPAPEPPPSFGTIVSTGGLLGSWTFPAGYCQATVLVKGGLRREGFLFSQRLGAFEHTFTVISESGRPKGVAIETLSPSRNVVLSPKQCARFDLRVQKSDDGSLGADVEVDCSSGDGGRVTASLHAPRCH